MNIEDLISQYIDGELSSEAEAELHHRLSVSPEDRMLFREHVALHEAARSRHLQHHPSREMEMALFARLEREEGASIPESPVESVPELMPLAAAAPIVAPRPIAADAPPVRSERPVVRRRRLLPLLVPFAIGVVALMIWRPWSSPQQGGDIAMNSTPEKSAAKQQSAPVIVDRFDSGGSDAGSPATQDRLSSPLAGAEVYSDAGSPSPEPSEPAREAEKSVSDGMASTPKLSSSRGPQNEVNMGGGAGMGNVNAAAESTEDFDMRAAPPPPPPAVKNEDMAQRNIPSDDAEGGKDIPSSSPSYQTNSAPPEERDAQPPRTPVENQVDSSIPPSLQRADVDRNRRGSSVPNAPSKPAPPPVGVFAELGDSYFDADRPTLRGGTNAPLDRLIGLMNAHPAVRIAIQGNIASRSSGEREVRLVEGRAVTVREYLVGRGISPLRIEFKNPDSVAPIQKETKAKTPPGRKVVVVVKDYVNSK